ncbi:hypothetical protein CEXT_462631 [Caerostris extrusa]|uniref:Uncharacterized protein n=1 Tax=Caerostris extrusa TaxID=172846 RepID=A0AAV4YFA9_CAEEX|nr:hypothetical protein CEXT_462631 [Caerostris extrusa]
MGPMPARSHPAQQPTAQTPHLSSYCLSLRLRQVVLITVRSPIWPSEIAVHRGPTCLVANSCHRSLCHLAFETFMSSCNRLRSHD